MALNGVDLLNAVEQWRTLPKAEIVRRCGYVSTSEGGQERLNYTAFFEALLEAKGLHLGNGRTAERRRRGRSGRSLPFHTKVQFNGNLMVGKAYIDMLEAQPGDHFMIRLGRDSIRLVPLDEA
ncbi:MAG: AbrB family transcriptional regulator [Synechococcaceae bacterium WB9_2_112]|nr:AbrB family transcriptional regulator [Synechococcaceae bacterium WB9_2_112]